MPILRRFASGDIAWHFDPELVPDGISLAFSERTGGRSAPPYDSLNMSDQVGDDPEAVAENRRLLMSALGLDPATQSRLHWCIQTHGTHVAHIDEPLGDPVLPDADALITATPGIPLLICVADCVPIIVVARGPRRALAVIHSGWKGTLARIAGAAVAALQETYQVDPADLSAYIGPYIGPASFEISPDVAARYASEFPDVAQTPAEGETVRLDLGAALTRTLLDAGLSRESIAILGEDTAAAGAPWYSYRASGGVTGRQAALACLLPPDGERVHA